jgi:hypothetical protein
MPGNTNTIEFRTLRIQWAQHLPMAAICDYWTISRDQLIRLRDVLPLAKRHDRKLRYKPLDNWRDPTDPAELEASEGSLALAPAIAERATCVSAYWDDATRAARQVTKPKAFSLSALEMPEELADLFDNMNRECER